MRKTLGIPLALLIGCAAGAGVRDLVAPARAQGQTGPSYEYETVFVAQIDDDKPVLNEYGRKGWRLSATAAVGSGHSLFFERQR